MMSLGCTERQPTSGQWRISTLWHTFLRLFTANVHTVPDDPTGEMPDDGARWGRDCLLSSSLSWFVTARRSRHRKVRCLRRTGYASGVLTLCRRKRLPRRRLLAAVSSSFSQTLDPAKRQNRSGKNHRRRTTLHIETVETRQRNMDHGSSPRLYAARSRSISSTSPPKLKSSGCVRAHSNLAFCHISNGGTPSQLIQSSPRNVSSSTGGPSTGGLRCIAI